MKPMRSEAATARATDEGRRRLPSEWAFLVSISGSSQPESRQSPLGLWRWRFRGNAVRCGIGRWEVGA